MADDIHDPGNRAPIVNLYAYLSVDDDGNEGVCGMGGLAMVAGYESTVKIMRPYAEQIAAQTGKKIRLVKFTARETIEEF